MKIYHAVIWTNGPDQPGQRITIVADSLSEAEEKLEAEYGTGYEYTLTNEEDAAKRR